MKNIMLVLELLRGVAKSSGRHCFRRAFMFLRGYFEVLVNLVKVFSSVSIHVVNKCLKIFEDMADSEIIYLNKQESKVFMEACIALTRAYGEHNQQRLAKLKNGERDNQGDEETEFDEISTLLSLLDHIASKDDFDHSGTNEEIDFACDCVLMGLGFLIPNLSQNILQYPTICHRFFELFFDTIICYPEKLATLGNDFHSRLNDCIRFAMQHQETTIVRRALEAISAIGGHHIKSRGKSPFGGVLCSLTPDIWKKITMENTSETILGPASDAMLMILIIDQQLFQKLANDFISGVSEAATRDRLIKSMQTLVGGTIELCVFANKHGSTLQNNLKAKREWRAKVTQFANEIRSFMIVK